VGDQPSTQVKKQKCENLKKYQEGDGGFTRGGGSYGNGSRKEKEKKGKGTSFTVRNGRAVQVHGGTDIRKLEFTGKTGRGKGLTKRKWTGEKKLWGGC